MSGGSLHTGSALRVVDLNAKLLEAGPLFAKFRIEYVFEQGPQYIVVLTLRHNERHVTIDESFGGLKPRHEVYLRRDFTPGLDPDQREVMSNGGYHAQGYSGAFGKKIDARGRLPFELGLNRPNSMGVMEPLRFTKTPGRTRCWFPSIGCATGRRLTATSGTATPVQATLIFTREERRSSWRLAWRAHAATGHWRSFRGKNKSTCASPPVAAVAARRVDRRCVSGRNWVTSA